MNAVIIYFYYTPDIRKLTDRRNFFLKQAVIIPKYIFLVKKSKNSIIPAAFGGGDNRVFLLQMN